ncbi:hypothetical protein GCM10017566_07840 [Amycolatopsis bartoniae]|uniref:Uncharacterized protein n=1 Tax=Amycolatopsis bartoniae TaxID=941986 RepID=A0A8H9IRJ7_9PSEU|nr:hypothetical protein GCM10017566_07840 [Amycolatopsis bartoniae]
MDLLPPLECGFGQRSLAQSRRRGPAPTVGGDLPARGVAQAVPEMPSVGDLDRVRQRIPHGLRRGCRTVPAHDFDSWMGPQPTGHHLGAAPGQYVDPGAGVGVDQYGGVVMRPAQGEIIDPQHPRHDLIPQGDGQQDPNRGVPSEGDPDRREQPGRGPAGQLAHDSTDLLTEPDGAPLISLDQARYLLPEGLARALGHRAPHPANPQPHQHPPSINRHIRGNPLREGMNSARRRPTAGARHRIVPG